VLPFSNYVLFDLSLPLFSFLFLPGVRFSDRPFLGLFSLFRIKFDAAYAGDFFYTFDQIQPVLSGKDDSIHFVRCTPTATRRGPARPSLRWC